jgi:ribosome-binding factor A
MSKRTHTYRGPSQRQLRAAELIRHQLAEIFLREAFADPALANLSLTISEVRTSPDLKIATAYCTPLGSVAMGQETDKVIGALNHAAPKIRRLLAAKLDLKFTPEIIFRNDESFLESKRIDELLSSPAVQRDLSRQAEEDDA